MAQSTTKKPGVPYTTQDFVKIFNSIATHKHRYQVFSDFVTMSAIALHNSIAMSEKLEAEYLEIVKRYKKDEVDKLVQLFAILVELLDLEPVDILGRLFMELELSNLCNGQFFTPHEVSLLMAKLSYGDTLDKFDTKPFITLCEPACGAGGMVLAFVNEMLKRGINPSQRLCVQCTDIDRVAAFMCYLQLGLWHIPAEIVVGDTLTMEYREIYYTPAYYIEGWDARLKETDLMKTFDDLVGLFRKPEDQLPEREKATVLTVERDEPIDEEQYGKFAFANSPDNEAQLKQLIPETLGKRLAEKPKHKNKKGDDKDDRQFDMFDFDIVIDHQK